MWISEGAREEGRQGGRARTKKEDLEGHPCPAFSAVGFRVGREGGGAWHGIGVIVGGLQKVRDVNDGGRGLPIDEDDEVGDEEGFGGSVEEDYFIGGADPDTGGLEEELLDFFCPGHGFAVSAGVIVVS